MPRAVPLLLALLGAVFFLPQAVWAKEAETVRVFAAASLTGALDEAAREYERATGVKVQAAYGASSLLARQIEAGAEAGLFISADEAWMDHLDRFGHINRATRRDLLTNRLVLVAPANSGVRLKIAPGFALAGALGSGRLAVADPESVPAGRYAKEALVALKAWDSVASRLARAENVRVALSYVAWGEAPLGIVYSSDAKAAAEVSVVDVFPESLHKRIVYPAAATAESGAQAQAFLKWLAGKQAAAIFLRHGFGVP